MTLEPQKHGHGGEPDKKKIHKIFLYFKFTSIAIYALGGYVITNSIIDVYTITTVKEPIDVKIWNTISITNESIFYGNIIIAIIITLVFIHVARTFSKRYRMIKHLHLTYCTCDRKRWYNRE